MKPAAVLQIARKASELPGESNGHMIAAGQSVLVFIDILLESDDTTPRGLKHDFSFSVPLKNKAPYQTTLSGPMVAVTRDQTPVITAPLRGSRWIAINAFSNDANPDHRRALNAYDGKERIPQRFAVDWVCIDPNGN